MSYKDLFDTKILSEPLIEFGHGQSVTKYSVSRSISISTYDINLSSHPEKINYAVMGDSRGTELFARFFQGMDWPTIHK